MTLLSSHRNIKGNCKFSDFLGLLVNMLSVPISQLFCYLTGDIRLYIILKYSI